MAAVVEVVGTTGTEGLLPVGHLLVDGAVDVKIIVFHRSKNYPYRRARQTLSWRSLGTVSYNGQPRA